MCPIFKSLSLLLCPVFYAHFCSPQKKCLKNACIYAHSIHHKKRTLRFHLFYMISAPFVWQNVWGLQLIFLGGKTVSQISVQWGVFFTNLLPVLFFAVALILNSNYQLCFIHVSILLINVSFLPPAMQKVHLLVSK